ncbi:hypothetical protein AOLI_G00025750 [Acnodon oligacanthus]
MWRSQVSSMLASSCKTATVAGERWSETEGRKESREREQTGRDLRLAEPLTVFYLTASKSLQLLRHEEAADPNTLPQRFLSLRT